LGGPKLVKIFVTGVAVLCVIAGFAGGVYLKERNRKNASESFNALFNVSKSGEIGYWIYSVQGGCPSLRALDLEPLVFVALPSQSPQSKLDLSQLKACIAFRKEGSGDPKPVRCVEGFVSFAAVGDANERGGSYSVKLADGREKSGEFRAAFCERQ